MFVLGFSSDLFHLTGIENGGINRFPAIKTSQHINVVVLTIYVINAISDQKPLASVAFLHIFTSFYSSYL
jgi:hypothetical protein